MSQSSLGMPTVSIFLQDLGKLDEHPLTGAVRCFGTQLLMLICTFTYLSLSLDDL